MIDLLSNTISVFIALFLFYIIYHRSVLIELEIKQDFIDKYLTEYEIKNKIIKLRGQQFYELLSYYTLKQNYEFIDIIKKERINFTPVYAPLVPSLSHGTGMMQIKGTLIQLDNQYCICEFELEDNIIMIEISNNTYLKTRRRK